MSVVKCLNPGQIADWSNSGKFVQIVTYCKARKTRQLSACQRNAIRYVMIGRQIKL